MQRSVMRNRALTGLISLLALGACKPPPSAKTTDAPSPSASAGPAPAASPAPPVASGPEAAEVRRFLEGLYAHYTPAMKASFDAFSRDESQTYAPDTVRLLAEDAKALKGDLGVIEADWVCNCQDFNDIKANITVQSATATTAHATVLFHDAGEPSRPPDEDAFDLVKTGGVWRIADITQRGEPLSLRATLEKEIKSLKAGAGGGPK